jgi:tetratricopeptide (TPR) repeat protein/tRNA A-37 threonylcarbamoyl transferase component Bud32
VIGRQVGNFYIIRSLGSGGMGVVYEARDTRLPRSVAVKFLKPAFARDLDAIRRFKREARLASSLNHPNICTILDVAEGDGQPFIAMELLHGISLRERLAGSPMALEEILVVASQAADGLASAHDQGIMHRDITPGNIFITDYGVVKLLDFGLAKHFAAVDEVDDTTEELTQVGAVVGTIHYMAPELFLEGATADHRCDLYSLGAVLYQMATGTRPFEARSKQDVMELIQGQPHIPLRRLAPHHPAELERIVDRLLAKRPEARYQTSWQLRADLQTLLRLSVHADASSAGRKQSIDTAIAILPFRVIGRPADAEEAGARLTGAIGDHLTQYRLLQVVPVGAHPGSVESMRELGARLNVRTVLEGSVQHAAGRVRVIANLIDAAAERPAMPAIKVERPCADARVVDRALAREVADRVATFLSKPRDAGGTHDAEASAAYRRGLHYWQARFSGGWRAAIEHFQHAVQRDERFALAHVALASAYEFLGFYCLMKPVLAFSVARQSIERALALDDALAVAHAELALIRFGGDWDWDGSEQAFRRALLLDPSNAVTHVCYSWLLMLLGRDDAAIAEARLGTSLAPGSRFVACGRAQTLYLARRYDEAIELCDECLRQDPDYVFAVSLRGQCYELASRFPEAVADLEHAVAVTNRVPFYVGMLGHCYGGAGMRARALDLVAELSRQSHETYVPPQCYVYIYAGLGDRARALEHQEKAYEDGASPFNYLVPSIRELYALDPQHKRRLEQMRLIL